MITYEQALKSTSKFAGSGGKCWNSEEAAIFLREVLQYMLLQGADGNVREFKFTSQKGMITLPKELLVPLKVRIDGRAGGVYNKYFEYGSGTDLRHCFDATTALIEDGNLYPSVYSLTHPSHVGIIGICDEAADAHVIVKGKDPAGLVIYSQHEGKQIVGEYLSIVKNELRTTSNIFAEITEVSKSVTNGYAELVGISNDGTRCFLSSYEPRETNPAYKRSQIHIPHCPDPARVIVIGRIKLKDYYAYEDVIPFDNNFLLSMAAQTVHSNYTDDIQASTARMAVVDKLVETEANYKRPSTGTPLDVNKATLGGAIPSLRRRQVITLGNGRR